ncbi:MAG: hypothetical protein VB118_11610 [Oscillospiraceae bacterium]|nr:hypothetical protein [Oscillospiraceae bacterium]
MTRRQEDGSFGCEPETMGTVLGWYYSGSHDNIVTRVGIMTPSALRGT